MKSEIFVLRLQVQTEECALIAMPSVPLILAVGSIVLRNQNDPIVRTFEGFIMFWICLALFYGALAKFSIELTRHFIQIGLRVHRQVGEETLSEVNTIS